MERETTIAAISTAQAPAGIGIIRISGPQAREAADRVFVSPHGRKIREASGYTMLYGHVYGGKGSGREKLDETVALVYAAPASFTGEDVVELSCHGGLFVLRRVLAAVLEAGAVPAGPGEFTRRAFLNGKMDLTKAESVMQIIGAKGEQAARTALAGYDGALFRRISKIRDSLLDTAAHLSAWADYPEDDIPEVSPESLLSVLSEAKEELSRLLDQFDAGRVLREGVDTVIVGRPNVGKSTLMNLLAGCERSIVTSFPGTTRDVVEDTVVLGGIPLRLADTAGIRPTDDPVESIGVNRAKKRIRSAELALAVFDLSRELNGEDEALIRELEGIPAVAVLNKSDLSEKLDVEYIRNKFKQIVYLSALTGEGLSQLEKAVSELFYTSELNPSEGILFTERQRDAARRAVGELSAALSALRSGMTLDAVTVSIEAAVSALLELTGERATTAIVDSVFSHFCVGK
ncbi:MAG TPA: tRNA uridine-5-carboxymethylaminomethyl(34) synthesis GTPase MnmE [Ruminococcaceae bacterium]|jgi:tRNA modification GTPase|nr:tRNA uridine-5-carboxymethylaminomethyl(34) synthesis GTPase MnmE [Oscillospiraceae bacterium]